MKKQFLFSFVLLIFSQMMNAQSTTVSGVIYDQSGKSIPGSNVVEKGTSNSVASDFDGKYVIKVSGPKAVLQFSSMGYTTVQIIVGQNKALNVTLKEQNATLNEVVVVGYGTSKKKDLTGSVVSANLKQFQEAPNTNILQSLQGSLPGVTIGQTNLAGEDPSIVIRGVNTLSGNKNVLIVLDGAIYGGKLSDINPKDIASVDVLKDPSSKAIYGAQAANGILMVTSKKGKKNAAPILDYSTYYAVNSPIKTRRNLNRAEFLEMARYQTYANPRAFLDVAGQPGVKDYNNPNPAWTYYGDSGTALTADLKSSLDAGTDFDWFGQTTNDAMFIVDHQLSIRGGGDKTNYFASTGYTDQQGWIIGDNFNRKSLRINFDTKVKDWITVGANVFGSFSDRSGLSPKLADIVRLAPFATAADANGKLIVNPIYNSILNPFLETKQTDLNKQNNISALLFASVDIPQVKGLNYRINYSNNYRWNDFGTARTYNGGSVERTKSSLLDYLITNILTYNRKFDKHNIGLTAVYEANEVNFESGKSEGRGITDFTLGLNAIHLGTLPPIISAPDQWRQSQISYAFRANYDFSSKYFVSASIRRDASSTFSKNNKSGNFPSFGLSYNITEEEFMKNIKAINFLKLRYTFGVNGNTTSRYSSLARFESRTASSYIFGDTAGVTNGVSPVNLGNDNLKWERTTGNNIGLDFGLFDNRISGSVDYYVNKTTDLLYDLPVPTITGFTGYKSNVGALENRGLEFSLNTSPIKNTDWEWNIGLNFSRNRSKILALSGIDLNKDGIEDDILPSESGNGGGGLFIGEQLGTVYQYQQEGIYQIGDILPSGLVPGSYKLKDVNGDGLVTIADRTKIGTTQPDFLFGISNSLTYRNFSFKFFINSIQGGIAVNDPWGGPTGSGTYTTDSNIVTNNRFNDIDSWTPINPNASYALPGAPKGGVNFTPYRDKSFVRLQDISFSYNLDKELVKRIGLSNFKFYVSGKNLMTWTNWEGWDPETGQGLGIDVATNTSGVNTGQALPVMKSYTFGVEITF